MSERHGAAGDRVLGTLTRAGERVERRLPLRVRTLAATLAAVAVLALAGYTAAKNAPGTLPDAVAALEPLLVRASLVVPAAGAVAVAVTSPRVRERLGLLFVGVFGLLAAVSPAAALPAAFAALAGGTVAVSASAPETGTVAGRARVLVLALVLGGAAVTLASVLGVASATARPLGSTFVLLGVAGTPLFARSSWPAWTVGGLATLAVFAVADAAPFVVGAVALVAGGVVGAPLWAVALAVGGALTAAVAALADRQPATAAGALVLLGAGVPASVPGLVAVAFGATLLAGGDR
jgi:hypothetical protein